MNNNELQKLAKLVKEKGFKTHTVTTGYTFTYLLGGKNIMINDTCIYLFLCEIQKWLREVHKIDVQPICNYHYKLGKQYHLGIIFVNKDNKVDTIIIKETDKSLDTIYRYYSFYEEALEVGLQEALKLLNN